MYKRKELRESKRFQKFIKKKRMSKNTQEVMLTTLLKYCNFHQMSLEELYQEADQEEELRIRQKKRKLVDRIEDFQNYLQDENYATNTIKEDITRIKTFYRRFKLEIPYTEPLSLPIRQIMYEDIPNKEHIKQAIGSTNSKLHKAIILFQYSSCSAMAETLSITCQMFIKATKEYHDKENINDVIKVLDGKKDTIPFFLLSRQKKKYKVEGGYKYYTCCTPEATQYILDYLKTRKNLKNNDKLFDIKIPGLISAYARLNDKNKWGKVGDTRFFHSHAMRTAGNTIIEDESVGDLFSGRKRKPIHEGYFKKNPIRIKEIYTTYLDKLSVFEEVNYNDIDSQVTKELRKELKAEREARLIAENKANNAQIMAEEANRKVDDFISSFQK